MSLNTYQSLCTKYYDLDKPNAPEDVLAFYMHFVENINGSILEPMCGTGRFLFPILALGYNMKGYDASPQMLSMLQYKAKALNIQPSVWQQFVEAPPPSDDRYELILIPSGSFGLITNEQAIDKMLSNFYRQLGKTGKLVFEAETPAGMPKHFNHWNTNIRYYSKDDYITLKTSHLPPENNLLTTLCLYEHIKSERILAREEEKITIRLYTPAQMIEKTHNNGFTVIQQHKAYEYGIAPNNTDEIIVYECMKN